MYSSRSAGAAPRLTLTAVLTSIHTKYIVPNSKLLVHCWAQSRDTFFNSKELNGSNASFIKHLHVSNPRGPPAAYLSWRSPPPLHCRFPPLKRRPPAQIPQPHPTPEVSDSVVFGVFQSIPCCWVFPGASPLGRTRTGN